MTHHNRALCHLSIFCEHRERLFAIAYRLLGTYHEAEDVLQEVYLQWQAMALEAIDSPPAILKTLTVRRATDVLRKASRQRESYIGPWLPGPVLTEDHLIETCGSPARDRELADSLSIGFMMLLEQLSATERAVYILRVGFDYSFAEIAQDLSLKVDHCRQLFHRAKSRLRRGKRGVDADTAAHRHLLDRFQFAIETGDIQQLVQVLAEDVILYSDGGGKAVSALRPIVGMDKVARLIAGLSKKWRRRQPSFRLMSINGAPGLLWSDADRLQTVVSFALRDGCIEAVFLIRNPDKINHLNLL